MSSKMEFDIKYKLGVVDEGAKRGLEEMNNSLKQSSGLTAEAARVTQDYKAAIGATGPEADKARAAYGEFRSELKQSQQAQSTMKMAINESFESFDRLSGMFTNVSAAAGKGLRMYEQYNIAQIRLNDLLKEQKDAQENVIKAQQAAVAAGERYQEVLEGSGEGSKEANAALKEMEKANKDLEKAQRDVEDSAKKVGEAQAQNQAQMVGFALQIPGFTKQIGGVTKEFMAFGAEHPKLISGISGMSSSFSSFGSAMLANPAILIIGAIAIAALALYMAWQTNFGGIREITASVFGALQSGFESFKGIVLGVWGAIVGGIKWGINLVIDYINLWIKAFNLVIGAYNTTLGAIPGLPRLAVLPEIPKLEVGGRVREAGWAVVGEAGPELLKLERGAEVTPLPSAPVGGGNIYVSLTIEGSADRRTAEYAVELMKHELRSVIVEPTSASATTKRIRRR